MTRDEFIEELNAKGFRRIDTVSAKWQAARVFTRDAKTRVMLIRTVGVDLCFTGLSIEEMANPQGLLSSNFPLRISVEFARDLVHCVHAYSGAGTAHSQNTPQFLS